MLIPCCKLLIISFGVSVFCEFAISTASSIEGNAESSYSSKCVDSEPLVQEVLQSNGSENLCSETFRYHMINKSLGLVSFSLYLPYDSEHNEISLVALKSNEMRSQIGDCSRDVDGIHSKFRIFPRNVACFSHQIQEIKWEFSYLFTGCYVVEVGLLSFQCSSSPFFVESTFYKELIADKTPSLTYKLVGQSLFASFNFGMHFRHNFPKTALAKINSNNTSFGKRLACCATGQHAEICDRQNAHRSLDLHCACSWNGDYLECTFFYVPPGYYYLEMEVHDTRCELHTIWTKELLRPPDPCYWEYNDLLVKNNSDCYDLREVVHSFSVLWWLVPLVLIASTATFIASFWYWRVKRNIHATASSPHTLDALKPFLDNLDPCNIPIKASKVFLLYPRDCKLFMDSMMHLRLLLQTATGCEVYDLWDSDRFNEIVAQDSIWALSLLSGKEVKVIVVLSPTSHKIEKSILNRKQLQYSLPDCRDDIFVATFKSVVDKLVTDFDRCRNFIVVRLNSKDCSQLMLKSLSPLCTIYTLPQHTTQLLRHLDLSPCNSLAYSKISAALKNKIDEYDRYVTTNPLHVEEFFD